jgi:hypothetical protein
MAFTVTCGCCGCEADVEPTPAAIEVWQVRVVQAPKLPKNATKAADVPSNKAIQLCQDCRGLLVAGDFAELAARANFGAQKAPPAMTPVGD